MASSASCIFPVMFRVRRKIFRSYLVTSSSNADTSPRFAAATNAGSSSRTTDDGKGCAFGAFTRVRFLAADIASETRKYHELAPSTGASSVVRGFDVARARKIQKC